MLPPKCVVCNSKKSGLLKDQVDIRLLSQLGIKTSLRKIPMFGNILFSEVYKKEQKNKFALARNKSMPEVYLRLSEFTYKAYRQFTKNKKEYTNSKKKRLDICLSEPDNAFLQHHLI